MQYNVAGEPRGARAVARWAFFAAVAGAGVAPAGLAAAQNEAVVERLEQHAQMPRAEARRLTRHVSAKLEENADRGGESYDRLRKAVNAAVFGGNAGPGRTRDEYFARLDRVLAAMRSGLDVSMLVRLFPDEENAAVLCANDFDLTVGQCDALIAAATEQTAALPYTPPDDGTALRRELRRAGVSRRLASSIVEHLGAVMLGVPGNLTRDDRGKSLLRLVDACPGGLKEREAQIRAWHIGPSPGMAKCIAQALSSDGGQERAERLLDLSPAAARTFLRWGAPEETTADRVAEDGSHPIDPRRAAQLRKVALEHYRAQRFATAAQAYEEAVRFSPQDARSYSGAGAARFALGDVQAAIEAYQQAVRLEPRHAGYHAALGRALTAAGNLRAAAASLQHALSIDPNHRSARQGLAYLDAMRNQGSRSHRSAARPASRSAQQVARGRAAPAPRPARAHSGLPLAPSREAVITTMRPLKDAVAGCAPGHEGVVPFMLTIAGETGQVTDVEVDGDLAGTDESRCMEGVVRSASFPRFQKSQLEIRYPFEL